MDEDDYDPMIKRAARLAHTKYHSSPNSLSWDSRSENDRALWYKDTQIFFDAIKEAIEEIENEYVLQDSH